MPHALHSRAGVKEEDLQTWNTALMTSYAGMIFIGSGMLSIAPGSCSQDATVTNSELQSCSPP